MLLDEHVRVVWVNKAFFDTFSVGAEAVGRSLDEVLAGRDAEPALWTGLEEAVAEGKTFGDLVIAHPFGRKTEHAMKFSARRLPAEPNGQALTLVIMEELPSSD